MTGLPAEDALKSIARDVQWAMDALHANESFTAERILARAWETYVMYRDDKDALEMRDKQV